MEDKEDVYKTIELPSEGIFKDKGSKFLAFAYPVNDEQSIKSIITTLKKEHFSARHHCYAYRLGYNGEIFRMNDDGEPSGTAGRPILGQLLSNNLTNILVVVVRYFGGTLLGVSGLINAYKNATIDVISNSDVVNKIIKNKLHIEFDYLNQNSVMKIIKDYQLEIEKADYGIKCMIDVNVRQGETERVIEKISKIEGVRVLDSF